MASNHLDLTVYYHLYLLHDVLNYSILETDSCSQNSDCDDGERCITSGEFARPMCTDGKYLNTIIVIHVFILACIIINYDDIHRCSYYGTNWPNLNACNVYTWKAYVHHI